MVVVVVLVVTVLHLATLVVVVFVQTSRITTEKGLEQVAHLNNTHTNSIRARSGTHLNLVKLLVLATQHFPNP